MTSRHAMLGSLLCVCATVAGGAQAAGPIVAGEHHLPGSSEDALIARGELLIGELGCMSCHRPRTDEAVRIFGKPGPRLESIAARTDVRDLRDFIADPQKTKPGTTMPGLFGGLSEQERTRRVEALVHFMGTLRGGKEPQDLPNGSVARGRELYHTVGCVACHAPQKDYRPKIGNADADAFGVEVELPAIKHPSVPLGDPGVKYTQHALALFLFDPLSVRPAGRMPNLKLSKQEAADIAVYLLREAGVRRRPPFKPAAEKVARGRELFASMGCAACHPIGEGDGAIRTSLEAASLSNLANPQGGCVGGEHKRRGQDRPIPDYSLNVGQRGAIGRALEGMGARGKLSAKQRVTRSFATLNCYACHERDGVGGPEPGRAAYFQSTSEVDLGDEGRLPPLLTGVGAKLKRAELSRIVHGHAGGDVRPYMAARMPVFGPHNVAHLTDALIDADDGMQLTEDDLFFYGRNSYGRTIAGVKGKGCVHCHNVRGRRSLGVPAMDLAVMHRRLQPAWFAQYMLDPARFRPGTRMPDLWPKRQPAANVSDIPRAKRNDELSHLWVYLKEIEHTRLPEGIEKQAGFELKPAQTKDGRPIVFRTFMQHAGLHAIAVGHPAGVHAAYDAEHARWAVVWRGRFLDAESTWDDRFTPLTAPLGKDVLAMPTGPTVTTVAEAASLERKATKAGNGSGGRFKGFELDRRGQPTFLSTVGDIELADQLIPLPDGKGLLRTVRMRGRAGSVLWLNAAAGEPIRKVDARSYAVGKQLRLRVGEGNAVGPGKIVAGRLLVPVTVGSEGGAQIVLEMRWFDE